jgi:hypothetical protein
MAPVRPASQKMGQPGSIADRFLRKGVARMNGIRAYVGKGRHILRRWVLDPKIHTTVNAVVAAASGFSSQSHFSAQFKKATGQTPSQYRRQMLSRLEP